MTIDRRREFYCGPGHKTIPRVQTLRDVLSDVIERTAEDAALINSLNYKSQIKVVNIMARVAYDELDKFIFSITMQEKGAKG